jgi:signal transduction histidine kinase
MAETALPLEGAAPVAQPSGVLPVEGGRRLIGALALAGVLVLTAVSILPRIRPAEPWSVGHIAPHVLIGGIWMAAGLIALWRQPANRVGLLMSATGFLWFTDDIYWWGSPLSLTLSTLLENLGLAVAAQLFLAFPSGRLHSQVERALVALAYLDALVVSFAELLFWDSTRDSGCGGCPRNVLLLDANAGIESAVERVSDLLAIGVGLGIVLVLGRRWGRAGPSTRRVLAPVLWSGALTAALTAGVVLWEDVTGTDVPGFGGVGWPADIAYATVPVAFLIGLARTQFHRGAIAGLVVELRSVSGPEDIRAALARTLGDPALELAYWLPSSRRYVDANGGVWEPPNSGTRAVRMLYREGEPLAAVSFDVSLLEEPELVDAAVAATELTLENTRLQAELRAQLAEVRASRARIVEAGDSERRRIERDLHDGAQQRLLAVRMVLQLARTQGRDTRALEALLNEADGEVETALAELRTLARGIHPSILTDQGLEAALAALARRAPLPVEVRVTTSGRLTAPVETAIYFLAAEALANIAKHANASHAAISVLRTEGAALVRIDDDGVGGADGASGTGLRGLRDRVEALDGRLAIASPPGGGTHLRAEIPCA